MVTSNSVAIAPSKPDATLAKPEKLIVHIRGTWCVCVCVCVCVVCVCVCVCVYMIDVCVCVCVCVTVCV